MTTGDAVCDVTYMFAPVLEVELVKKTEEDEEVVAAASYIALAESVTKTVSTWVCCLALSLPLIILPSFLRQLSDRGLDTTDASSCPFISRQRIAPVTYPLPLSRVVITTAHYSHGPLVLALTPDGMDLVNVAVVMLVSGVGSHHSYPVLIKHHDNISNEDTSKHHYGQQ